MKDHPSKCLICGQHPKLDDDGTHVEEVYAYQRIEGKLRVATEIVLHQPMYFAHAECVPA